MKPDAADNSVPREISALLSNERLILRETQRAVTPLGGVAVFVAFLHKLGFVEKLRQHMPIQWKSPTTSIPRQPSSRFSWPCCQNGGRGCGWCRQWESGTGPGDEFIFEVPALHASWKHRPVRPRMESEGRPSLAFIGAGSMARFIVPGTRAWSVMSQ